MGQTENKTQLKRELMTNTHTDTCTNTHKEITQNEVEKTEGCKTCVRYMENQIIRSNIIQIKITE